MLEQQKRRQPHDFRLGGKQPQQQPRQADRLVAKIGGDALGAVHRRIALVEDKVDHRRDRCEPLGAIDGIGCLERDAGGCDAGLGAGDALLHRRFADEKGTGDLPDGEPRYDAQCKRDLLGCRKRRVAADEEQPQDVVAVMRPVEAIGEFTLPVVEIGEQFLRRQCRLARLPPHLVDAAVAADEDEPGGGIARRTGTGPVFQRPDTGLLERLLRQIEIAKVTQQRTHCLRPRGNKSKIDPACVGHEGSSPGL